MTEIPQADFLSEEDALCLNQIMGKSYVNLFHFVEEYIIKDVERLVAQGPDGTDRCDALKRFCAEEIKHQALFRRFMDLFDAAFGPSCKVLDFADEVSEAILENSPIAVLLTTFHLELITQEHFLCAVRPSEDIEPSMVRILEYHWIDEARHAAIDLLELREMLANASAAERGNAFDQYRGILRSFYELLSQQAHHDVEALVTITGAPMSSHEAYELEALQHQGYVRIFIEAGLEHPLLEHLVSEGFPQQMLELKKMAAGYKINRR